MQHSLENEFGRFFYTEQYMKLKNYLFNYRLRKSMIGTAFNLAFPLKKKEELMLIDIGSGISPVSPFPKETLFIELEEKAVDFLKSRNFSALQGDITKLPLKSNIIDAVFCSEVLEHVKDYKKALEECNRVLKNKGVLFLTVPINMHYWNDDDEYVGHFRRFNPQNLIEEIKKAGFKIRIAKPIGSWFERFITNKIVKVARNSNPSFSSNFLKDFAFSSINTILLFLTKLSLNFTSMHSSSIILIAAEKV